MFQHLSMILPFVDNFVCVFTTAMVKGMIEPYFRNVTDAIHYDVIHTNDANHYDIVHENELNNYAVKNIEIYNYDTSKNEVLAKETFINNILANNSSSNSAFQSSSSQNEVAVLFCIQGAIYMMTNLFIGVVIFYKNFHLKTIETFSSKRCLNALKLLLQINLVKYLNCNCNYKNIFASFSTKVFTSKARSGGLVVWSRNVTKRSWVRTSTEETIFFATFIWNKNLSLLNML